MCQPKPILEKGTELVPVSPTHRELSITPSPPSLRPPVRELGRMGRVAPPPSPAGCVRPNTSAGCVLFFQVCSPCRLDGGEESLQRFRTLLMYDVVMLYRTVFGVLSGASLHRRRLSQMSLSPFLASFLSLKKKTQLLRQHCAGAPMQ